MQAILVAQSGLTLKKLAGIADAIKDTNSPHQVATMATPNPAAFDLLVNEVRKLTLQVSELSRNRPAYRRDRSKLRGTRSRTNSENRNGKNSVGTTDILVKTPVNAVHHVSFRETNNRIIRRDR